MFWFFGHEACGILTPWAGIEPAPPALKGKVLTTGPPGKSLNVYFLEMECQVLVSTLLSPLCSLSLHYTTTSPFKSMEELKTRLPLPEERQIQFLTWAMNGEKLLQPEVLGKALCKPISNHFSFLVYLVQSSSYFLNPLLHQDLTFHFYTLRNKWACCETECPFFYSMSLDPFLIHP